MSEKSNWSFPDALQPRPEEVAFDLDAALDCIVSLRTEIPEDAYTAQLLGTERVGNGVVIRDDGLVLTIGYLTTEAEAVWLTTNRGVVVPGHPLAYDQASGYSLVLPLGKLAAPVLERGSASSCRVGDDIIVAGHGGCAHALKAKVIDKREFAGYWEYLLDEAIFTAPAHPQWGGTALIGNDGRLLGIGSLLVQEVVDEQTVQGNMMVPIDILEPILDDLLKLGRANRAPRAWLGLYAQEADEHLAVNALASGGPADRAGVRLGDVVLAVAGTPISGLADFYRKVWALGPAGTEVPLLLARKSARVEVRVRSANRSDSLKKPRLH